jgi:hypothetical protein
LNMVQRLKTIQSLRLQIEVMLWALN